VMMLMGIPVYVCASASVPWAAALVAKGLSPGAALVFLMAGPTTNVATMGAIFRAFGKKVLVIYLGTVAVLSMALGLVVDGVIATGVVGEGHVHGLPGWASTAGAVVLLGLMAHLAAGDIRKWLGRRKGEESCAYCQGGNQQ